MLKTLLGLVVSTLSSQRRKPGGFVLRKKRGRKRARSWPPSWKEAIQLSGEHADRRIRGLLVWVVVNADSEESRPAGQDPSSIREKQTKKDDLPRSEFRPRKIPCVYFIFFFLTAQEQREDDFCGEKKRPYDSS